MKKWSGQLPRRNYKNPSYSTKVFLGGVPWDITEGEQLCSFVLVEIFLSEIYKKSLILRAQFCFLAFQKGNGYLPKKFS